MTEQYDEAVGRSVDRAYQRAMEVLMESLDDIKDAHGLDDEHIGMIVRRRLGSDIEEEWIEWCE